MSDAFRRHEELAGFVLEMRSRGALSEEAEEEFLAEMDRLWIEMTPEERTASDRRASMVLSAPEALDWIDTHLDEGRASLPRRAA